MATQTPASKHLEQVLTARFPGIRFGRYNCRKISGSTTWSQHSWNNALDIYPPKSLSYPSPEYKTYLDEVHKFIRENILDLNVRVLLWQVKNHYNHIHADFWPRGWATPPCAGGSPRYKYPDGTIESTARLLNEYTGDLSPITIPDQQEEDAMRVGNTGKRVERVQQRLLDLGYELPRWGVDGDFGGETEAAVIAWQTDVGLEPDGVLLAVDVHDLLGGGTEEPLAVQAHERLDRLHLI